MTNNLTYSEAIIALEELISQLEEGVVELENLPATIQHANELIHICETKLRTTNDAIDAAMRQTLGKK